MPRDPFANYDVWLESGPGGPYDNDTPPPDCTCPECGGIVEGDTIHEERVKTIRKNGVTHTLSAFFGRCPECGTVEIDIPEEDDYDDRDYDREQDYDYE